MLEYKKGHVEIGPSGEKLLHCPYEGCDKVLTSSPGLRYHMRTHCGNDRPYLCTRCKKTFKSANGLKYHTEKTKCEITIDVTSIGRFNTHSSRTEESYPDDDVEVDVVSTGQLLDIESWKHERTASDSGYLTLSHSPYTTNLKLADQEEIVNPLTQLAIIATGPHSPLLYNNQALTDYQRASQSFNASIHSYAKPPPRIERVSPPISRKRSLSFSGPESKYSSSTSNGSSGSDDESQPRSTSTTSELEIDIDPISNISLSDEYIANDTPSDDNASSKDDVAEERLWPEAKWQCFISGTNVRIENGIIADWTRVEDRFEEKYLDKENYAPHGLRLFKILAEEPVLHLVFSPVLIQQDDTDSDYEMDSIEDSSLFAQCQLDHPFFVKDKGWCSCYPSLTEEHYGIQCCTLDINDICLPPHHPDASFTRKAVKSLKSLQFTPEDSNAVFALSQMARSRKESSSLEELSRSFPQTQIKPIKKKSSASFYHEHPAILKAKRPMNAFMLFAKKFRLQYTQMHPGKDNRAISVLLGERWKRMKNDERKAYAQEAKKLADQFRKQNPDCWKRKRSVSESFIS